jgi:hypothetical protein
MIIQIDGGTAADFAAARRSLEALARDWECEFTEIPPATAADGGGRDDSARAIDPVAAASLIVSVPSAALAVLDLTDRIHKRRRAKELIDQARRLAGQHLTVSIVSATRMVEVRGLTADQVLDLTTDEYPGG